MASRLKGYYQKSVGPMLSERFKYKNPMQIPVLQKIVYILVGLAAAYMIYYAAKE